METSNQVSKCKCGGLDFEIRNGHRVCACCHISSTSPMPELQQPELEERYCQKWEGGIRRLSMVNTIKERIAKIIHNNWGLISEKDLADLIFAELAKDGQFTRISDRDAKFDAILCEAIKRGGLDFPSLELGNVYLCGAEAQLALCNAQLPTLLLRVKEDTAKEIFGKLARDGFYNLIGLSGG